MLFRKRVHAFPEKGACFSEKGACFSEKGCALFRKGMRPFPDGGKVPCSGLLKFAGQFSNAISSGM